MAFRFILLTWKRDSLALSWRKRYTYLSFISPLKLSNYFHHKWKAGCTAKIGLKLLSLMTFGISVFPLWSKFRTSVLLYFSQCPQKALSLRSRLHTQSTICSFHCFRTILRSRSPPYMIFIPIIFISNKNYLKVFVLVSYLEFTSHYIQKENSLSANPHVHIER